MRESCIAPQKNSPTIPPRRLFGSLLSLSLPSSTLTTPLSRHRDSHCTPASPNPGRQTPGPDSRGPSQTRIKLLTGKSTPKTKAHHHALPSPTQPHATTKTHPTALQTATMRDVFMPIVPMDADFFYRGFIGFGTLIVYALIAILIHKLIFDACNRRNNVVRPARERLPGRGAPGGPRADGAPEH